MEFEGKQQIIQPPGFGWNLYEHQRKSVHEMLEVESAGPTDSTLVNGLKVRHEFGCNSDTTGYGKTVSMAALLHLVHGQEDMTAREFMLEGRIRGTDPTPRWPVGPIKPKWVAGGTHAVRENYSSMDGLCSQFRITNYKMLECSLVLTSHSIIGQWMDALTKASPNMRIGLVSTRKAIQNFTVANHDVVLVTPTMYNNLVDRFKGCAWKRFIFDEPGHIRVPAMHGIVAEFVWLVTATPNAILNLHGRTSCSYMYKFTMNSGRFYNDFNTKFPTCMVRSSDEYLKWSYTMVEPKIIIHRATDPVHAGLREFLKPDVASMVAAGDISSALEVLGAVDSDTLIDALVKAKDSEIRVIEHDMNAPNISDKNLKALRRKLSDVIEQRSNITKRQEEMLVADCVICSEPLTDPVIDPKCQNMFCGKCMLRWLEIKGTCPMCRARVDPADLAYVSSGVSSSESKMSVDQPMSRVETLLNIVSGKDDRKIIVYSSRNVTFSTIRSILPKGSFVEVSGGVSQRTRAVNKWKNGKVRIIFLNSSTNSSGLNLQMATDIVLYHDMSGDTLKQVLGRPVRIGRTTPLTLHKIVTA